MVAVLAHDREPLDELIWRTHRLGPAALTSVLAANGRLCADVTLSAGQRVIIPDDLVASGNQPSIVHRTHLWS